MSLMRESDPRFAHLERKAGAFVLAALLLVAGAVAVVGVRQGFFTPKATVTFYDDSGRDLVEGMEVVTRGFRVGKVAHLRLTENGKVECQLAIEREHLRWIREDSVARVVTKALIGDSRIDVSSGSPGARPLESGGRIAFKRDPELTEIAARVMEEVKPVLYAVRDMIQYLDDPKGDVKTTLATVNRLTAGLNETREHVDRAVAELAGRLTAAVTRIDALAAALQGDVLPKVSDTFAGAGGAVRSLDAFVREDLHGLAADLRRDLVPQVRATLETTDRAVAGAGRAVQTVDRELPALLEKVGAALENIRAVTGNLVPASREAGGVLAEGGALVDDTQALVKRTREIWPFRGGNPEPVRTIDVDSYRGAPGGTAAPGVAPR